jgi:GNAT superfamily N-acetyltransferase
VEHGPFQRSPVELIFPGLELARRLEASDAANAAASAKESIEAGGGVVAYAGPTSPLSHAIGLGMHGPVTDADLDRVEAFYRDRDTPSNIDLCPLADHTLMEKLGRRGYRITEFNNVLVGRPAKLEVVRRLDPSHVRLRICGPEDSELWSRTMVAGFFDREDLSAEEIAMGERLFRMPGAVGFIAEVNGTPAAAGTARKFGTLVTMFGDSTLPRFRGRGLQKELIALRLEWAEAEGCDLATAATLPGTPSQRNYMRAGFAVAYTKMNMCRELRA